MILHSSAFTTPSVRIHRHLIEGLGWMSMKRFVVSWFFDGWTCRLFSHSEICWLIDDWCIDVYGFITRGEAVRLSKATLRQLLKMTPIFILHEKHVRFFSFTIVHSNFWVQIESIQVSSSLASILDYFLLTQCLCTQKYYTGIFCCGRPLIG